MYDVIIIGSGPSGLFTAYHLKDKKVLVLEKNSEIGGKIKVSGGGRCNVTNLKDNEQLLNYIPQNSKFLYSTLNKFNSYDLYDFFISNGVELVEEDHNRVFPSSHKSESIINVFKNIKTLLNYNVSSVDFCDDHYIINNELKCRNLVVATGGITYKHLGTTGFGYEVAEKFDIDVTDLFACEVALTSNDELIRDKALQGITLKDAKIELISDNKVVYSVTQNILFAHFGLSGPAALHCSYYVNKNPDKKFKVKITPQNDIPKRVKKYLETNEEIVVNIDSTRGFKTAFVTGGGVSIKELNPKTYESKKMPGLYFIGEVTDVNAFTGGYNMTVFFSQGYSCADAINNK